jgi:apolipoprotein N-acyltransferase
LAIDWIRSAVLPVPAWGLLGHTQWSSGTAQLAAIAGVPLVSSLVAATAAVWASAVSAGLAAPRSRLALALTGTFLALSGLGERVSRSIATGPAALARVLVVQPHVAPDERWSPLLSTTLLDLSMRQTRKALEANAIPPDFVVWPETAITVDLDRDVGALQRLVGMVEETRVPLLAGAIRASGHTGDKTIRNAAIWIEPGFAIADTIEKTHAVPILEADSALGRFLGERVLRFPAGRQLVAEATQERPLRGRSEVVPTLCYEVFFPSLVSARRSAESRAIVDLTSDSWSVGSRPAEQQIAIASFRAIEQRLPLVRASHGGPSAIIDEYGRVIARSAMGRADAIAADLTLHRRRRVLEAAALIALAAIGACAALALHRFATRGVSR